MNKWHLVNPSGMMAGCVGFEYRWTRDRAQAIEFTKQNTGPMRREDFWVNAQRWAKQFPGVHKQEATPFIP